MKIGIVTLYGHSNYGNKLQNYALQYILKKNGIESETIEILNKNKIIDIKLWILMQLSKLYMKFSKGQNKKFIIGYRYNKFVNFSNKYIKVGKKKIINYCVPKELNNSYDYFITGSDQVWNPEINNRELEINFLQFTDKQKRVAFAPSFGGSDIPLEKKQLYKNWLKSMQSISVREVAGQSIIKDLIGEEYPVLVDPTLLLEKSEWLSIAKEPKWLKSKDYILTYFLGNKNPEYLEKVNEIAKRHNFSVINLLDIEDRDAYCVDPSEFIYLINHAKLMCTDSFHGAVFSIIMKCPFIVFERIDNHVPMNSRIDTLLKLFNMENRREVFVNKDQEIFNIDFKEVDLIINREKEKSINFLNQSFGNYNM